MRDYLLCIWQKYLTTCYSERWQKPVSPALLPVSPPASVSTHSSCYSSFCRTYEHKQQTFVFKHLIELLRSNGIIYIDLRAKFSQKTCTADSTCRWNKVKTVGIIHMNRCLLSVRAPAHFHAHFIYIYKNLSIVYCLLSSATIKSYVAMVTIWPQITHLPCDKGKSYTAPRWQDVCESTAPQETKPIYIPAWRSQTTS